MRNWGAESLKKRNVVVNHGAFFKTNVVMFLSDLGIINFKGVMSITMELGFHPKLMMERVVHMRECPLDMRMD